MIRFTLTVAAAGMVATLSSAATPAWFPDTSGVVMTDFQVDLLKGISQGPIACLADGANNLLGMRSEAQDLIAREAEVSARFASTGCSPITQDPSQVDPSSTVQAGGAACGDLYVAQGQLIDSANRLNAQTDQIRVGFLACNAQVQAAQQSDCDALRQAYNAAPSATSAGSILLDITLPTSGAAAAYAADKIRAAFVARMEDLGCPDIP